MTKLSQARDPNTSPETLSVLATDKVWVIRYWVAQNPNTSPEILWDLATDKDEDVRYSVGQNPNATELIRRIVLMTDSQEND